MSTSPNKPCVGERHEATTQDHERFIEHQRLVLLRYLDGTAPGSAEELDALGYVESVLAEWQEVFGKSELTDPSPEERTFWFALYQLEELVETSILTLIPTKSSLWRISSKAGNYCGTGNRFLSTV